MLICGVDVGYRYTKAYTDSVVYHEPSFIGEPVDLFDVDHMDMQVSFNGKTMFVGSLASKQSIVKYSSLYEDRSDIESTRPLIQAGIAKAVLKHHDTDLRVITGLPVSYYFKQKDDVGKSLQNLPLEYNVVIGTKEEKIKINSIETKIVLQPLGSFMAFMLDEYGEMKQESLPYLQHPICVLDLGFFTLDVLVLNGFEIDHRKSYSSYELGSHVAYRTIQRDFLHRTGRFLNHTDIDSMIQKREHLDIVQNAFTSLGRQIKNEYLSLNTKCGLVIITGGNARLISNQFSSFPTHVPENPAIENVKGYVRLGERAWKTKV